MVSADNCSTLWLSPPIRSSCCHPGYLWRGHPVMMVRRCIRRRSSDHLAITRDGWSEKGKGFQQDQQDFGWSWYRFMNFSPGKSYLVCLSLRVWKWGTLKSTCRSSFSRLDKPFGSIRYTVLFRHTHVVHNIKLVTSSINMCNTNTHKSHVLMIKSHISEIFSSSEAFLCLASMARLPWCRGYRPGSWLWISQARNHVGCGGWWWWGWWVRPFMKSQGPCWTQQNWVYDSCLLEEAVIKCSTWPWIPIPTCFSLPETTMKVDHDQLEKIIWHCHFRT